MGHDQNTLAHLVLFLKIQLFPSSVEAKEIHLFDLYNTRYIFLPVLLKLPEAITTVSFQD